MSQVNHPEHYNKHPSGIECIDVVEDMSFNLGNAIKYIWRADLKADKEEDLKKALWYIERELGGNRKVTEDFKVGDTVYASCFSIVNMFTIEEVYEYHYTLKSLDKPITLSQYVKSGVYASHKECANVIDNKSILPTERFKKGDTVFIMNNGVVDTRKVYDVCPDKYGLTTGQRDFITTYYYNSDVFASQKECLDANP